MFDSIVINEATLGQLLIRNISDDVIDTLKTKARLNGTLFSPSECEALSREFHAASGGPWEPLSKDDYREGLA